MRKLQQVKKFVANLSLAASAVLLSVVSLAMFVNVLDRFIFKMGLMWVETFSRYGLIWSVFLASNVLIYRNELMRVDFLDNLLPAKFKSVREKIYTLAFVLMLAILIYYGWRQAVSYIGVIALGLPIDKFWVYLCVPVGAALMLFQYLTNLILLLGKRGQDTTDKEAHA